MWQDIFDTGGRGKWNGSGSGGGRDGILSIIVNQLFLDIITCSPARNPAIVGEDNLIVCQIPFAEAMVDVVCLGSP
jgi:hypothetical protein